jgi:aspartate carbamoyltransferase catalytic subunit
MINHFLTLSSFSSHDISRLLDRAQFFFSQQHQPDQINHLLKNKIIANIFYEPSTRTRCSFEIAAKRLGAEVVNFVPENSSVKKGETIYDTLKTLESLGVDAIVLRHADDYVFEDLKDKIRVPMINAGAGRHEHPSQGLLDLLTLKQEFNSLSALKIAACGDIKHSRVAGSLMVASEMFGMEVHLCGPSELLPETTPKSARKSDFDKVLPEMDAVMMLRIQFERHSSLELDPVSYHKQFGLTYHRVKQMKKEAILLHPGPFNRDVEISSDVVEHPQSRIFKQMSNGVFARMAILEWALIGDKQ